MKPVYPAARELPSYENLLLEMVEPNILKVTLNRPKSYNALSHGLVSDLTELAKWLVDEYYNIRVVLLYGGDEGKGFKIAMQTLDGGRIGIASQALGIAEGAIDETVAYVKERKQFGRSIAQFQNTQFELAEMKARVDAAKYLVYAAAQKKQAAMNGQKVRYSVEAAEAKLIAARTASDVTRRCLQLFGGYGYTRDYPIERMLRDAKLTEINEGTSEVQMMVISGALLK